MTAASLDPPAPGGLSRARRALESVLLAGFGRGAALAAMAAFAALLPLDQFGLFAHGRSLLLLLAPTVSLGFSISVMRRAPQLRAEGREAAAAGHLAMGYAAAVLIGGALALGAALWPGGGEAALMLAGLPAYGALFLGAQAARALERPMLAYLPTGAAATLAAAALAAQPGLGLGITARGAAWLFVASGTGVALWQAIALFRAMARPRFPAPLVWLGEAAPLTLSLIARGWVLQGPFLLLPLWASGEALGIYGLALTAAQAVRICSVGVNGVVGPGLNVALGRDDRREARAIIAWAQRAAGGASLAVSALLLIGWAGGARLFAPELAQGLAPLALLLTAAVVMAIEAPLGLALIGAGAAKAEIRAQSLSAAAAMLAGLALIPAFGAAGAAGATLCATGLRLGLMRLAAPTSRRDLAPDSAPRGPKGLSGLRAALRADHFRMAQRRAGAGRMLRDALAHKTFRVLCSYRLYRAVRLSRRRLTKLLLPFAVIYHRWTCLSIGAEIAWQAEIGPGCRILHGFGIVILPCARIGANVTMAHGACVGYRAAPERPQEALSTGIVEDDCFIGPFAFVWARMGRGSVLAPHSMLLEPAAPGSVLVGAPARVARQLAGTQARDEALAADRAVLLSRRAGPPAPEVRPAIAGPVTEAPETAGSAPGGSAEGRRLATGG